MALYWSYNSVPALASLSKARRKEIWRACRWSRSGILWSWLVGLMVCVPWFGGLITLFRILMRHPNITIPPVGYLLVGAGAALVCTALTNSILLTILMPEIRKCAGCVCAKCGYDLRATPDRCPECGTLPAGY